MSDSIIRLGKRVRHLRQSKNLTQEKLAELSGISGKYVGDLERGEANVSIQVLEQVATSLQVTISDLLDNEHEASREKLATEIQDFLNSADDQQVKTLYRCMKNLI